MSEALSDGELVRRIAAAGTGARELEAALCRRFAEPIRLYGLRHLRNADRALDLVQSVSLRLLEAARQGRITDPDNVHRFVLGICRHLVLDVREDDRRAQPAPAEALATIPAEQVEPLGVQPARLVGCLDRLDTRTKQVVMLSFQEGRAAAEIAELLRTTAGNVRVLRHRALSSIRRCLDGEGGLAS